MIKVLIRYEAKKRGIETPAELSRSVGVTKPTAARLWDGTFPVDLATLDKICKAWDCALSDLVQYVKRNGRRKA